MRFNVCSFSEAYQRVATLQLGSNCCSFCNLCCAQLCYAQVWTSL